MDHTDHVNLLRDGVSAPGGTWADLGCGAGAFTLALAELVGDAARIYAVDQNAGALRTNAESMRRRFPHVLVHYQTVDFTQPMELPELDGIVIANSLHFQRAQSVVVSLLRGYLREGGRIVVVEYNIEQGNSGVPHPVPYRRWEDLAREAGFEHTELLRTRPSRFLREIYSAVSW
ncbi:MAG: class I SAM-dependent methyltransferase [Dehalococcoidia bacterium]